MNYTINSRHLLNWIAALLFITIGILNLILVHPIPAVFYVLLSCIYLPPVNDYLNAKFSLVIPAFVKVLVFLAVMWATLGVGDLAEILGL